MDGSRVCTDLTRQTRGVPIRFRRRQALLISVAAVSAFVGGCGAHRVRVPLMPPLIPAPRAVVLWREAFDALDPATWREVIVRGRTEYDVVDVAGERCLRARSHSGASILLSAVRFDADEYEWLSWRWRVDQLVEGEALERKDGSDAAARVYVYFETSGLPWQKRSLDYVWSASLPVGAILSSAFSSESKIIVAESGAASLSRWRTVERNLEDDYERCFGTRKLPPVIAVGIMTDTDNTGASALAYFDDLQVSRLPAAPSAGQRSATQAGLPQAALAGAAGD